MSRDEIQNAMQALMGGLAGHNAKPATKKSVVEQLESQAKTVGSEEITGLDSSCALCLNDYAKDDKVTKLDCGHWFHMGQHLEPGSTEVIACEGITAWLKTSNDCQ